MSTSNLGGLCGLSCKTDQSNYNMATGVCAYTDTSNPKCDQGAAHEMYFRGGAPRLYIFGERNDMTFMSSTTILSSI